MKDIGFRLMLE